MEPAPVSYASAVVLSGGFLSQPVVPTKLVAVGNRSFKVLTSQDNDLNRFVSPLPVCERAIGRSATLGAMRVAIWEAYQRQLASAAVAVEAPAPRHEDTPAADEPSVAELLGLDVGPPTKRRLANSKRNQSRAHQVRVAALPPWLRVTLADGWSFAALVPNRQDQPPTMEATAANWEALLARCSAEDAVQQPRAGREPPQPRRPPQDMLGPYAHKASGKYVVKARGGTPAGECSKRRRTHELLERPRASTSPTTRYACHYFAAERSAHEFAEALPADAAALAAAARALRRSAGETGRRTTRTARARRAAADACAADAQHRAGAADANDAFAADAADSEASVEDAFEAASGAEAADDEGAGAFVADAAGAFVADAAGAFVADVAAAEACEALAYAPEAGEEPAWAFPGEALAFAGGA